jgi:hypothetical protein
MGQANSRSEPDIGLPVVATSSRSGSPIPVPHKTRRLRPAGGFGKRFIIFADAEEEFDWNRPFDRSSTATETVSAVGRATARLNAAGAAPVYLCDYPIVNNPESAAIMRELVEQGACAIGTQLHPWVSPPFDEDVTHFNSYTGNLPVDLQRAKTTVLTEKIADAIGVRPTVYRAGRYGLGPSSLSILAELGYVMDVSVRATFDYSAEGGPNFADMPIWPWLTDEGLLELPLTSAWTGTIRSRPWLHKRLNLRGLLARARMLARIPLTPEGVPLRDALDAIQTLHDEGLDIFSLSFHTPSLVPGHTPYVRDATDLRTFWNWWDGVFDLFARLGVLPVTYDALLAGLKAAR